MYYTYVLFLIRAILCITLIRVLLLSNICKIFNTFQLNNNLLNYVKVTILQDFFYGAWCPTESLPQCSAEAM